MAGGDAAQPRHHAGQAGNKVNHRGNRAYHKDNGSEIRQRFNRPRREQKRVHVETLRNADSLYSGDETDTHREEVAEDLAQHVEEEPLTLSNEQKEENETSASNTVINHTKPASKEHNAKSDTKDKTSGNTESSQVNIMLAW